MFRWTDVIMLEVFIEAANHPEPLYRLSIHMQWEHHILQPGDKGAGETDVYHGTHGEVVLSA